MVREGNTFTICALPPKQAVVGNRIPSGGKVWEILEVWGPVTYFTTQYKSWLGGPHCSEAE